MIGTAALASTHGDCYFDPVEGEIRCDAIGGVVPPPGGGDEGGGGEPDPIRYLYITTDPVVGDCYYWSRIPGGIDTWDPANDPTVIITIATLPPCPGADPAPGSVTEATAWEVFRSFPLDSPTVTMTPADHGITGLPTYVGAPIPAAVTHDETLPDGAPLTVQALVAGIAIDWGDGATHAGRPADLAGYPDGTAIHTYRTKTCTPDERADYPTGLTCHPTLDHYAVTVTFVWTGRYRVAGPWLRLGTITTQTTISYDVDEIVGVPVAP